MSHPKAVVFDLGKVLVDFDWNRAVQCFSRISELSENEIFDAVIKSDLLIRYESGFISSKEFFKQTTALLKCDLDYDDFRKWFGDIFEPIPEMIDLNNQLRASGVPTFIFSNTNELAIQWIRGNYPFFADFNDFVLSYEHQCMKPDAHLYEVVEQRTGLTGSDLIYLDDRIENVESGQQRGWQVIHHQNHSTSTISLRTAGVPLN
ncbi:MAG TPA: HAD family phosphatase [Verrucomicrobiales bacterium]|nr:HAD family phosphatase [Verrucomicrobiales bacterium]HIL70747.1 HAD family phosphatase [Verrucomicrobiota bacterium]